MTRSFNEALQTRPKLRDQAQDRFVAVSPLLIFPEALGAFRVYLKQGNWYVLYASENERFTEEHSRQLHENGVSEVFIEAHQQPQYEQYIEDNLGDILSNTNLPIESRANFFYGVSSHILKNVYTSHLPDDMDEEKYTRIENFVKQSTAFLSKEESIKAISSFVSHDYKTYTHCVHVFLYTMMVLHQYSMTEKDMVQYGIGAVLHDIGKTRISRDILNKSGKLTPQERERINNHPVLGVAVCSKLSLSQEAVNSILFHHERNDGRGYPAGLRAADIPLPVRVISMADAYDALTSDRPYARGMRPFSALSIIRDTRIGSYDKQVYKQFIMMLGGAGLV